MQQIKWTETSDKDKIGLIIEHIMKWQVIESPLQQRKRQWPIAWYEDDITDGCWYVEYTSKDTKSYVLNVFDPLNNMHDAWLVVERITEPPQSREEALKQAYTRFMRWWQGADIWAMRREEAAEAICIAALKSAGLEVVQ